MNEKMNEKKRRMSFPIAPVSFISSKKMLRCPLSFLAQSGHRNNVVLYKAL